MVSRLGLNGLKGAGEEPGLSGFCFGIVGCDRLGVALSWSAGDGNARITEQIVFPPSGSTKYGSTCRSTPMNSTPIPLPQTTSSSLVVVL